MPRWSTATTEKSRASAGMTSRNWYHNCGQPCTSSSGGPSLPVTACRRSSPVSTYRLVNVPVNPAGRFGAPETEPGPSGVGGEVIRIPFHAWYCLTIVRRAGASRQWASLATTLVCDSAQTGEVTSGQARRFARAQECAERSPVMPPRTDPGPYADQDWSHQPADRKWKPQSTLLKGLSHDHPADQFRPGTTGRLPLQPRQRAQRRLVHQRNAITGLRGEIRAR